MVGKASEIVLKSGGNIKFDLKAHNPILSKALSGVDNGMAYKNFANIAKKLYNKRPEIPVLTATTLLVPGYVDSEEIESIASFISNLNNSIPYSLLIFHPDYWMRDLPATSINQVIECYGAAVKHLENVHVGNLHIVGLRSMGEFLRVLEKNHKN
jgi:pyruvate formate lyase activating enzyme